MDKYWHVFNSFNYDTELNKEGLNASLVYTAMKYHGKLTPLEITSIWFMRLICSESMIEINYETIDKIKDPFTYSYEIHPYFVFEDYEVTQMKSLFSFFIQNHILTQIINKYDIKYDISYDIKINGRLIKNKTDFYQNIYLNESLMNELFDSLFEICNETIMTAQTTINAIKIHNPQWLSDFE